MVVLMVLSPRYLPSVERPGLTSQRWRSAACSARARWPAAARSLRPRCAPGQEEIVQHQQVGLDHGAKQFLTPRHQLGCNAQTRTVGLHITHVLALQRAPRDVGLLTCLWLHYAEHWWLHYGGQ